MENTEIAVRNGHNIILQVLNSDYRNVRNKTLIKTRKTTFRPKIFGLRRFKEWQISKHLHNGSQDCACYNDDANDNSEREQLIT